MTAERLTGVARERRLANLRASLAVQGGSPPGRPGAPARRQSAARGSGGLALRLARAVGGEALETPAGWLVRRVIAPAELPLDRARLATLPGHPPRDAPLVFLDTETTGLATAAGTLAFLVGLARWDRDVFRQTQLLLPDHADEPALLAALERWVTPDAWLVTYNGRGFDWPLIEARFRLAGRPAPEHAGHLDLLPFVRRVYRHRMEDARLRTVEERLLGLSRTGDVAGWEIPAIYLEVLRGGPVEPLAGVVVHNERDVRSLGLLLSHLDRSLADRGARGTAARGDLAGLARAYAREGRHGEALACLDEALARPDGSRDPFGDAAAAAGGHRGRGLRRDPRWWEPRARPDFGRPAPAPPGAGTAWTDERIAAERGRALRRLHRWAEAAEAWRAAAAAGGPLGAIAWIEVAKLREHRLADAAGALAAAGAARRILERSRALGRPYPRVEADLGRRAARLAARIGRTAGTGGPWGPAG